MKHTKLTALALTALALAACGKNSETLGDIPTFERALHAEYTTLGDYEAQQGDFMDARFYRKRAKAIMKGFTPEPTDLSTRSIPAERLGELETGREILVSLLSKGATGDRPLEAAHAQAMFDCWAEQQEENFQHEDIEGCRGEFWASVNNLMPKTTDKAYMVSHMKATSMVYFDTNSSYLSSAAKAELDGVAEKIIDLKPRHVLLTGHADTTGTVEYNKMISRKRAETAAAYLKSKGVDTSKVNVEYVGQSKLIKETGDNVSEQANRVVKIVFVK